MNILVTGCCGFIGSNFVHYMLKNYPEYHITNIDKLTYAGNPDNLKDVEDNPHYTFVKADINDAQIVAEHVKDKDVIINFAAESHVDRSIDDPDPFLQTNILGTHNLLKAALTQNTRFIQISTDEVYGSIEEGSFTETSPLDPSSPYSASKASADLLCMSYHITHQLPVTIVRSSNNFGPYQYPEKAIPLFITNLLEGKKIPLYGDGKHVRNWIYVEDNCAAIATVLHKGEVGHIYNAASDDECENIELVHKILSQLGKDDSLIEPVEDRKGHDRRYSLNASKAQQLGWKQQFSFEQGLQHTIRWYTENQEWWKKLKS